MEPARASLRGGGCLSWLGEGTEEGLIQTNTYIRVGPERQHRTQRCHMSQAEHRSGMIDGMFSGEWTNQRRHEQLPPVRREGGGDCRGLISGVDGARRNA